MKNSFLRQLSFVSPKSLLTPNNNYKIIKKEIGKQWENF